MKVNIKTPNGLYWGPYAVIVRTLSQAKIYDLEAIQAMPGIMKLLKGRFIRLVYVWPKEDKHADAAH